MTRNWIFLVLLSLIWGASFMGVTLALTGFGPLTVAAIRIVMGALVLVVLAQIMGVGLPAFSNRRLWLHVAGMGLFSNAVPFFLLSWGQQHVSSGFAGITMAVVPLLVLPLAHVFVPDEHLTPRKAAGFAVGFIGVAILIGPGAWASSGAETEGWARLACVGAAACYAIGSIITRLSPKTDLISFSAGALLVASLLIAPVALAVEGLPTLPNAPALWAVTYLGLFPTALATILLVQVIRSAGPSFLSIVNYLVPLWSVLFGVMLLSERLPASFLYALGLILAGLAISRARAVRRRP
ncbi:DMT family transporter [Aliiroseovarius subalbicans]|uniref:DMT family transporter n=1 Tax=Aliiroseovarius subalbicans TaxID=2925840 RepID=UPI001F56B12C|nr:DMT family transporter [Aliiroseovarius subalbicans]MCI2399313.1 DMT family transporter [Aliiroseovarius subalbicans]